MMQSGPLSSRGGDGLEEVLRGQRIHRRHAGNINNGDFCFCIDNRLQKFSIMIWVRWLSSVPITGSADSIPQFDHRRRQFRDFALLTDNDFLAVLLEDLKREEPEFVEKKSD